VDAIYPEEDLPAEQEHFLQINADLAKTWPYIDTPKDPLPDADDWANVPNKLEHLDRG
jgi:ferredoxin